VGIRAASDMVASPPFDHSAAARSVRRRVVAMAGARNIHVLERIPAAPYGPLNYALSASSVRFLPYMIGTGLGMLPDTLVYVPLGSAGHLLLDPARRSPAQWALLALGVAATGAVTVVVARAARWRLATAKKAASGGND
jgi:uncharacterized membrane protein YdjX (TVP38/TMEM64 family)